MLVPSNKSQTSLAQLPVLLLDCQATGANPTTGQLLEIGWAKSNGSQEKSVHVDSHLLQWPEEKEIPPRVSRVTGITEEDLKEASRSTPAQAWSSLIEAARQVNPACCPLVIHFARFEEAYLKHFHKELSPEERFPFDIICTHEITKRLLPELPRRGLRAVAGYFGHSVPELRRSTHHVTATAFIWSHLVEILSRTSGVQTREDLRRWLASTHAPSSTGRAYPMEPRARLSLPDRPGVYRMKRSNGDLLYVGKAKSLSRRVNSYFQKRQRHAEHILEMLTQASRLEVTVTPTALEAALLESDEIKALSPPYNIALREKNRRLGFCSPDFRHFGHRVDERLTLGPLPSPDSLKGLAAISQLVELEDGKATVSEALAIPPTFAPDADCFAAGFKLFRDNYAGKLSKKPVSSALITMGTLLWREQLAAAEEPSSDTSNDSEDEEKTEHVWTPENVASSLEKVLIRAAHLSRRARWLCLLSESSLAWKSRPTEAPRKNLLVFEAGRIAHRDELAEETPIPPPPGYEKRARERQRGLDLMAYDRLIVLTRELRRLISEGRSVELRSSPRSILKRKKLVEVLRWV